MPSRELLNVSIKPHVAVLASARTVKRAAVAILIVRGAERRELPTVDTRTDAGVLAPLEQ